MLKNLLIIFFSIALFSCTNSYVKNNIKENNWQAIGEHQAKNGLLEQTETELQTLSDKYGDGDLDYSAYQQGYLKEIINYCQPLNAYKLGKTGRLYNGVCKRFPHGSKFRNDWDMASGDM
ncbi:MAG: DUF2799 domain-containing protein [Psychromonas sp.]